jgi:hypothetical protein
VPDDRPHAQRLTGWPTGKARTLTATTLIPSASAHNLAATPRATRTMPGQAATTPAMAVLTTRHSPSRLGRHERCARCASLTFMVRWSKWHGRTSCGRVLVLAEQALAEVAERVGEHPGDLHLGDAELLADLRLRHVLVKAH